MMATPTISLAMMSLMQTPAKDGSPAMSAPRAALLKRMEEVATKVASAPCEKVLRSTSGQTPSRCFRIHDGFRRQSTMARTCTMVSSTV